MISLERHYLLPLPLSFTGSAWSVGVVAICSCIAGLPLSSPSTLRPSSHFRCFAALPLFPLSRDW